MTCPPGTGQVPAVINYHELVLLAQASREAGPHAPARGIHHTSVSCVMNETSEALHLVEGELIRLSYGAAITVTTNSSHFLERRSTFWHGNLHISRCRAGGACRER